MTRTLLALLLLYVMAVPALAQRAPLQAHNFMPTGAWKVQPTVVQGARQLDNITLPCMMMLEFNNGFVLRLSGGNGRLLAMALDVRQNVFNQGQQYNVAVAVNQIPEGFIRASAFTNSVLILNVRETPNFYQKLAGSQLLTMDIEGNVFQFNLGNIQEAANRLESCYSGKPPETVQMAGLPGMPPAPMPLPAASEINPDKQWALTRARVSKMPDMPEPKIAKAYYNQEQDQRWTAKQGESLFDVLQRWGSQSGVTIDWQANGNETVVSNFESRSSFEQAVQALLAQNATTTGIQADLRGGSRSPSSAPQPLMPVSTSSMPVPMPPRGVSAPSMPAPSAATQWQAARGDDLRIILQRWSEREGIELYWQANQPFAVKQNLGLNGPYPQAIETVLGQYLGEDVRPLAQLNTDPTTGRRILIIESSRSL